MRFCMQCVCSMNKYWPIQLPWCSLYSISYNSDLQCSMIYPFFSHFTWTHCFLLGRIWEFGTPFLPHHISTWLKVKFCGRKVQKNCKWFILSSFCITEWIVKFDYSIYCGLSFLITELICSYYIIISPESYIFSSAEENDWRPWKNLTEKKFINLPFVRSLESFYMRTKATLQLGS